MKNASDIQVISLNHFDGMTSDQRETTGNSVGLLQQFNNYSRTNRLTPYVTGATSNGDSNSSTYEMGDFLYYNGIVHGLGHSSGGNLPTLRTKDALDTTNTWTAHTNNAAGSGTMLRGVFVEYQDSAYGGYGGSNNIWKCKLDWTSFTDNTHTAPAVITSNGLNASYNATLYFGCGNVLISNNAGSWNDAVLTLSSKFTIVSLTEFDHYLAIGCKPSKGSRSVVFLWDMNTSPTRPDVTIDWGTGNLVTLKQVEEYLIGVSLDYTDLTNVGKQHLTLRKYLSGSAGTIFRELITSTSSNINVGGHSIGNSQLVNGRMYFAADLTLDGTEYSGLWGIGKMKNGEFGVWFDRSPLGDTLVRTVRGFLLVGEHAFISYDNGGTYDLSGSSYNFWTGTSAVETSFNQGMAIAHRTRQKQLLAIAVSMVPLPAGGTCILKYSLDGASFTTAKTETTTGTVTTEMPLSGLSGTNGREIKLRVESKGNVEITEIKYKYEALETLI